MRSILSEIAEGGDRAHGARDAVREEREAIVAHLTCLWDTPLGASLLTPEFGRSDATLIFHEYPGSVESVRKMLLLAIQRYEPRLSNVVVSQLPTRELELVLRFEVKATMTVGGVNVPVRFTSTIDSSNRIELA